MATSCHDTRGSVSPTEGPQSLPLRHIIGFNGRVMRGLVVHPEGQHIIYPVGANVIVEKLTLKLDGGQEILSKHIGHVTAISVSPDGRYIASGEQAKNDNSQASVVLWDFCNRQPLMEWPSHTGSVASIVFLCDSHLFISLGGDVDGRVMVFSALLHSPTTSKPAQPGRARPANVIQASRANNKMFISGGSGSGRIWTVSPTGDRLDFLDLKFGYLRHEITCIEIADHDSTCPRNHLAFCGTTSGDVLIFSTHSGNLQGSIPKKVIPYGVTSVTYTRMIDDTTFNLLVGSGEGKVINYNVSLVQGKGNKVTLTCKYAKDTHVWSHENEKSAVTSIAKLGVGHTFYVGTGSNHIYEFNLFRWAATLARTCSNSPVYSLAFARGTDDLLVIGERNRVRVFNLQVNAEVRRYDRPDRTCLCCRVNHDGTHVFTGWDSGEVLVLGFEPACLTLRELYRIDCAQKQAVTSLDLTSESTGLVTGGRDGQVRVWRIVDDFNCRGGRMRQGLLMHQLSHGGSINTLKISSDDKNVLSACHDGSAVVYRLDTGLKVVMIKVQGHINAACFCSNDLQIVTVGGDGMLRYWEIMTGDQLREMPVGGPSCSVDALCVLEVRRQVGGSQVTGSQVMATGSHDTRIRLWDFDTAEMTHVGKGHGDPVLKAVFGPCGSVLVSSSGDGSICVWDMPALQQ